MHCSSHPYSDLREIRGSLWIVAPVYSTAWETESQHGLSVGQGLGELDLMATGYVAVLLGSMCVD